MRLPREQSVFRVGCLANSERKMLERKTYLYEWHIHKYMLVVRMTDERVDRHLHHHYHNSPTQAVTIECVQLNEVWPTKDDRPIKWSSNTQRPPYPSGGITAVSTQWSDEATLACEPQLIECCGVVVTTKCRDIDTGSSNTHVALQSTHT